MTDNSNATATNALQVFRFEDNEVRTIEDELGELWFVAADVCRILELTNTPKAVSRLDDDEKNTITIRDSVGRPHRNTIINRPGVYNLTLSSRQPVAKRMRRWLTHDVIPSIRDTGSYSLPGARAANDDTDRKLAIAESREKRLVRDQQNRSIRRLAGILRDAGHVANDVILSLEISAEEAACGRDFSMFKPKTETDWASPTAIADRLGVSIEAVGRAIAQLGLCGNIPGMAKATVSKAVVHEQPLVSYIYSPVAVEMIEKTILEKGPASFVSLLR